MAIIPNVTEFYYGSDGLLLETVGDGKFYPQNNYANLIFLNLQDGGAENSALFVNFTTEQKQPFTSHWFYASFDSLVQHVLNGDVAPTSFARYAIQVPQSVIASNNSKSVLTVHVTPKIKHGTNYVGAYGDLTALQTAYDVDALATQAPFCNLSLYDNQEDCEENGGTWVEYASLGEQLNVELAVAYVFDTETFYQVEYDGELLTYSWEEKEESIDTVLLSKGYAVADIYVQRGFSSALGTLNVQTEYTDYIMRVLSNLQQYAKNVSDELDNHIEDLNNPHQVTADQVPYENETSNLIADDVQEAIDETVSRILTAEEVLSDIIGGNQEIDAVKLHDSVSDTNALITFDGKRVVATYGNVSLEIAENEWIIAKARVNITEGQVIQFDGPVGGSGQIWGKPAVPSEVNQMPELILGIATETVSQGQDVRVNWFGTVNLPFQLAINGTPTSSGILYYDSTTTTNGKLTYAKPIAPKVQIEVCAVEYIGNNKTILLVRPSFGSFLKDLHDVHLNGNQTNGITIVYNSTNSRWEAYNLLGKVVAIENRLDALENYNLQIGDIYETKEDAIIHKSRTTALETFKNVTVPDTYETIANVALRVPKATTIIGIDLQDNITLSEFKTALGNATTSLSGLMSNTDKSNLDSLVALLSTSDGDNVVNTIGEILAIFNNYPEGADLVTALNGKVDKITGYSLVDNELIEKLEELYNKTELDLILDGKALKSDTYTRSNLYTKTELDNGQLDTRYYTETEVNAIVNGLQPAYGLQNTNLTPTPLTDGQSILTSLFDNKTLVVLVVTNLDTNEVDTDMVGSISVGKKFVFFDNSEIQFEIGETNSTFTSTQNVSLKITAYQTSDGVQAEEIYYDNEVSLLEADNVQEAIDEVVYDFNAHQSNTSNPHSVTKTQVGLSNVDNTSDVDKPVSTAQQTALNGKSNIGHTHIKTDITDFAHTHPISEVTNLQTSLNNKLETSLKGAVNGLAELDSNGKVPSSQLPSYVDDVLEYANLASFPTTGETGKIYIAQDTNKTYRWSGSAYVEISSSLALGETDSTAYRGDRGKTAYDHTSLTNNPHSVTAAQVGAEPAFTKNTAFNKNFGTTAGTVAQGNDSRLSDARTPLSHTHGDISNTGAITSTVVTPANTDHIIIADDSASGVLKRGIAIGTGTTTYLRNDGTWQTPPDTNTTYTEITEAEIVTGTASDLRTITARRAKYAVNQNFSKGVIETRANTSTQFWTGTQAQYDAIETKSSTTLYFIT